MRFAVLFSLLAAACVWLASGLGLGSPGGVAGMLCALGLVGPSLAYASGRPEIIGKTAEGTHPGWAQFLHGSYLGFCRASAMWARMRGVAPWSRVQPELLLGARPLPGEVGVLLAEEGVGAVLDLTCELVDPARLRRQTAYLCLPVLDGTPPSASQLTTGVDFLAAHCAQTTVLVHCAVGRGRSATLVVAWLVHTGRAASVDEAERQLQSERPCVRLHPAQKAAVHAWLDARPAPWEGAPSPPQPTVP